MHNAISARPPRPAYQDTYRLSTSSTAWNALALRSIGLVTAYLEVYPVKSTSPSPFEHIVPVLRHELVVATLAAALPCHQHALPYQRSMVAVQRLLEALRQACSTSQGKLRRSLLSSLHFLESTLIDFEEKALKVQDELRTR